MTKGTPPRAVGEIEGDGRHVPLSDFTAQNQIWVSTSEGQGKAVDLAVAVQENGGGGGGGSDLLLDGSVVTIRFNTLTEEWDLTSSDQPWLDLSVESVTLSSGIYFWNIAADITGPGYVSVNPRSGGGSLLEHYAQYNDEGVVIPVSITGTSFGGSSLGQPTSSQASEFINMTITRLVGPPIDDPIDIDDSFNDDDHGGSSLLGDL